jgi:hypothetical protein
MVRCLEGLIIRMIYLMTCRKGLSIYPLLLFVFITDKEQSHHRITGALVAESLTKDLLLAVIQQRLLRLSNVINYQWCVGGERCDRHKVYALATYGKRAHSDTKMRQDLPHRAQIRNIGRP